jgi:hypothetical protein
MASALVCGQSVADPRVRLQRTLANDLERCVAYNLLLMHADFTGILSDAFVDALVEDVWERAGTLCTLRARAGPVAVLMPGAPGTEAHLPATQLLGEVCRKNHLSRAHLGLAVRGGRVEYGRKD